MDLICTVTEDAEHPKLDMWQNFYDRLRTKG